MTRWRVAARIARREVRRHWARSALVVLIIALPVAATQAVAIAYRSDRTFVTEGRDGDSPFAPEHASADEYTGFDPRLGRPPILAGAEQAEIGFSIHDWTTAAAGPGEGPDDLVRLHIVGYVPDRSEIRLDAGRVPASRHEVVVTHHFDDDPGLAIGEEITVVASRVDLTIVGTSSYDGEEGGITAWAGPPVDEADDWMPAALARIRDSGTVLASAEAWDLYWFAPGAGASAPIVPDRVDRRSGPSAESIVAGAAVAAIAIGFVATTCSAAFAIGARRQLRQLGILATTGAGPGDLLRAVLLQGTTLGLAGGLLATTLTYTGRAILVRRMPTLVERGSEWQVAWAPDLIVAVVLLGALAGTVAALVPAITASRIPTLSALAGRRPTRRRPLRSPYLGLVLVLAGLGMLSWASGQDRGRGGSAVAVSFVGVLATMVGGIAVSPALVAGLAAASARVRNTLRLSGRSLARDGMRSAAVVASTAVALAIPVIVLIWAGRDTGDGRLSGGRRADEARIEAAYEVTGQVHIFGDPSAVPAAATAVEEILGSDAVVVRQVDGEPNDLVGADAVDPDQLRATTGDDAVADALDRGALVRVSRDPYNNALTADGRLVDLPLPEAIGGVPVVAVDPEDVSAVTLLMLLGSEQGLVAAPADAALEPSGAQVVVYRGRPVTGRETTRIGALSTSSSAPTIAQLTTLSAAGPGAVIGSGAGYVEVYVDSTQGADDEPPLALIAFLASLFVALAVVGTASALAAADGKGDGQIVAAVGAPPTVVRRRRALEATLTAGAAVVLGGGLASVATLVVIHSPFVREEGVEPVFRFPFLDVAGVAVGSVLVIGSATWLCLAVAAGVRGRRDLFLVDG